MMRLARNLNELFNYIKKDLQDSMNEVGEQVSEKTKRNIDKTVYEAGTPSVYERTYQLRDSIKNFPATVDGDSVVVEIDHDTSLIISIPEAYQHGSLYYEPNDISEFIDVIVHEGLSGDLFGNGYWRNKRQYFKVTIDELMAKREHVKWLKEAMKRKGYDVK